MLYQEQDQCDLRQSLIFLHQNFLKCFILFTPQPFAAPVSNSFFTFCKCLTFKLIPLITYIYLTSL